MAQIHKFRKAKSLFSTTLSVGIGTGTGETITLSSTVGLPTDTEITLTFDRVDADGIATPAKIERITGIIASSNFTNYTRGIDSSTDQVHSAGAVIEYIWNADDWNDAVDGILVEHNQNGTHNLANTSFSTLNSPRGFLINGKIVPSVTNNDLTVAIKGLDDNDPSATNPVYCRIGDTVRSITAALSVTKADGTNWCNAGGAELATQEADYFVYLGYNATDGVVIGFSRIPYAEQYSNFSTTTTNEKYCAISTITTADVDDCYENIGRFAATLSAGAGYTWTVPTFINYTLIQRPIYETRSLIWTAAEYQFLGTTTTNYSIYKISGNKIHIEFGRTGTASATPGAIITTVPFRPLHSYNNTALSLSGSCYEDSAYKTAYGQIPANTNVMNIIPYDSTGYANGTVNIMINDDYLI